MMSFLKKMRLRRKIRGMERAYGVSLKSLNEDEISVWFLRRDPYLAELFGAG
jgi:hypothetical protein